MVGFWKGAHDEGGLAWDDSNNNRAFLSGTICATNNGASIYIESKRKPEAYRTETGTAMREDTQHTSLPAGPAGQFSYHGAFSNVVMSYSKKSKGRQGVHPLDERKTDFREVVHVATGLRHRLHDGVKKASAVD